MRYPVTMRLGLLADIHSNAPALIAVLDALGRAQVDAVIALGDLVGYNAMPHETLELIRERRIPSVAGNHDLMAIGRLSTEFCGPIVRRAIDWTRQVLTPMEVAQLATLPEVIRPGPRMLCVHATLGDATRRLRTSAEFLAEAERLGEAEPGLALCLMGHDHHPCVHATGPGVVNHEQLEEAIPLPRHGLAFVNPGTVGQPRDQDPRASFAIFDSRAWTVTLHRVEYDRTALEAANARAGLGGTAPTHRPPDDDEGFLTRIRGALRRVSDKFMRMDQ